MRLSYRSQLPLYALLLTLFLSVAGPPIQAQSQGQVAAQIPPAWNDAVARLASRIGSVTSSQKTISISVKNISSLTDADVTAISQALKSELTRLGLRVNGQSSADTQVSVTLSEGESAYVWVGEVQRGSDEQTEIVSVTKTNEFAPADANGAISLDRKLVWQQPSKFLDFALSTNPVGAYSSLIILEPTRLNFFRSTDLTDWERSQNVDIPNLTPKPRDIVGVINVVDGEAFVGPAYRYVSMSGIMCRGGFDHPEKIQCSNWKNNQIITVFGPKVPGREDSESVLLWDRCGDKSIELVTGNGDFTEPDDIQGYFASSLTGVAIPSGPALNFDGPVLALQREGRQNSARVVVHNLKTGNYEGYIVTATCGH